MSLFCYFIYTNVCGFIEIYCDFFNLIKKLYLHIASFTTGRKNGGPPFGSPLLTQIGIQLFNRSKNGQQIVTVHSWTAWFSNGSTGSRTGQRNVMVRTWAEPFSNGSNGSRSGQQNWTVPEQFKVPDRFGTYYTYGFWVRERVGIRVFSSSWTKLTQYLNI